MTTQTVSERTHSTAPDTTPEEVEAGAGADPPRSAPPPAPRRRSLWDRIEAWLSRVSSRNNFTHRLFSLIWLPYAFRSGIRMKRLDERTFTAVLPFNRFNKNWYNAMAGAALLANSEIAGGMYIFGICGGEYVVVCKRLEYRFLRPCLGPALYKIEPAEDVESLAREEREFNVTLTLNIVQQIRKPGERERRVGRCIATFHATPKHLARARRASRA